MSDDDYAADSPFDGFDDYYFWDDGASQDVADDLAEHTMPSPVYLEDPAYEMMGGYSDWEYYSDDYYDDDPILLKNNPQAGSPPVSLKYRNGQASSHKSQKHGRKRKLAHTEEIPSLSLDEPGLVEIVQNIGQNITGTTWKIDKFDSEELYHHGEAKRVALLKDWRSVFQESQPKSDRRSKGMSNKKVALHEDWANDLSLADMGLMTAKGKHVSTNDVDNNYDQDEDEEPGLGQDRYFELGLSDTREPAVPVDEEVDDLLLGYEDEDFSAAEPARVKASSPEQILTSRKRKKPDEEEARPNGLDPDNESDIEFQLADRISATSKKRKTGMGSSASARSIQRSNTTNSVDALETQTNGTQNRGRRRPKKQTIQRAEDSSTNTRNAKKAAAKPATTSVPISKKRKPTIEAAAGEDDGTTVATTSSRAKRVASDNKGVRHDDGNQPMTSLPEPTTRRARTRKK